MFKGTENNLKDKLYQFNSVYLETLIAKDLSN